MTKKRPREPKPIPHSLASATGPGLIKHLASCNSTIRSQSLKLLQSWLLECQAHNLSDSDFKKLWKGLFYCLWHADKTPNQVALIDRLVSLFLSLKPSLSLEFFRGFLVTLRREWPGIDRLRLDKFYLLIRRFVRGLFELMRLRGWDLGVLGEYLGVLERDGFLAEEKGLQGNGVSYHVVSVFWEELKGVGGFMPVRKEVVDFVFGPFFAVLRRGKDRILVGKLRICVFEEMLRAGRELLAKRKAEEECDEKDGDVLLGVVALRMGLAGRLYEVGSSGECVQGNRKVALALHEEFLKLEKELDSSGVEISIPEYSDAGGKVVDDGDDNEVPQLIPIEYGDGNGDAEMGSNEGADDGAHEDEDGQPEVKKRKKAKKGIDGADKKDKKKKKKKKRNAENVVSEPNPVVEENGDSVTNNVLEELPDFTANGDDLERYGSAVDLEDENVILNLQKQFEKVAAEAGSCGSEGSALSDIPIISVVKQGKRVNKRKRVKGADKQESHNLASSNGVDNKVDASAAKSVEKSEKKVSFSMKNNLVWKPQTPLPPESLRLPPTVTPRGSALKKGVPPGPVVETPTKKKVKQKKKLRSATPAIKRRKSLLTRSA